MKKNHMWDWMEKQEKELKKFTKELVLAVPNLDKKTRIKMDALDYVTEGVLSLEYKDR